MSKQDVKQKGFTIIEVVLVLAIAALIFLMVFIALPALQRNQRDTARKEELGKVVSAVTTWQSTHRGVSPDSTNVVAFAKYVDGTPASGNTEIQLSTTSVKFLSGAQTSGNGGATTDTMVLAPSTSCSSDGSSFAPKKTSRSMAAMIKMESGDAFFCQEA